VNEYLVKDNSEKMQVDVLIEYPKTSEAYKLVYEDLFKFSDWNNDQKINREEFAYLT
jgi:hypothetical protein